MEGPVVLEMSSEAEPLGEGLTAAMAGQWPCLTHSRSALFQRIELNLARVDLFFPDLLPFKSAAPQSPTSCIMHRSGSEINQSLKEMDLYSRLSSGAGFLPSPPSSLGVLSTDATRCVQAGRAGRQSTVGSWIQIHFLLLLRGLSEFPILSAPVTSPVC